jgi:hypothetical protein
VTCPCQYCDEAAVAHHHGDTTIQGHNLPNIIIWGEQELGIRCGQNSRQLPRCSVDSLPLCGDTTRKLARRDIFLETQFIVSLCT